MSFEWVGAGASLSGFAVDYNVYSKPALRVNQSSALKWAKTIIQSALADFRC